MTWNVLSIQDPKVRPAVPFLCTPIYSFLVGELNSIWMFSGSFVLFGENLFQPEGLSLGSHPVQGCGIVEEDELLTTTVTAKSAHFLAIGCPLSRLTLLNGNGIHPFDILSAAGLIGGPLIRLVRE